MESTMGSNIKKSSILFIPYLAEFMSFPCLENRHFHAWNLEQPINGQFYIKMLKMYIEIFIKSSHMVTLLI
jgi:hypothetical protein